MSRTHATPAMPITATDSGRPAWDILEAQGLALRKITLLAEVIANSEDGDGDMQLLADIILDVVQEAQSSRDLALHALRTRAAS